MRQQGGVVHGHHENAGDDADAGGQHTSQISSARTRARSVCGACTHPTLHRNGMVAQPDGAARNHLVARESFGLALRPGPETRRIAVRTCQASTRALCNCHTSSDRACARPDLRASALLVGPAPRRINKLRASEPDQSGETAGVWRSGPTLAGGGSQDRAGAPTYTAEVPAAAEPGSGPADRPPAPARPDRRHPRLETAAAAACRWRSASRAVRDHASSE